jgi:CubicO group peptidase (beta-lactamase class C family)
MTTDGAAGGHADGVLAPLANILERLVAATPGAGMSLAVYRDGQLVVDLAAGAHEPDSLQLQFSVSKAVTAIAAAHAVEAGLLDLDAPISDSWDAFRRSGTRQITPRMVLTHTSGLAGVDTPLTIEQLLAGDYTAALERQDPFWEPGTRHGYHAFSFGPLMDGVFRHTIGRDVRNYVADEIAGPRGLDLWFGCPPEQLDRVVPYTRQEVGSTALVRSLPQLRTFADRGSQVLGEDYSLYNRPDVLQASWPNANVVTTARDLARLLALSAGEVDGDRLLSAEARDALRRPQVDGIDWVLQFPIAFGTGVQLPFPQLPLAGPGSYGHEGAGGCVAFADPERGLAVAFSTSAFPALDGGSPFATAVFASLLMLIDSEGHR